MNIEPCPKHPDAGYELQLTPDKQHYGRYNCAVCGKFRKWSKSPSTTALIKEREDILTTYLLAHTKGLTECDIRRVLNIAGKSRIKYEDETWLNEINIAHTIVLN